MNKILDTLAFVFAVMFIGVGTYASLNVVTRPEMITVAVELPQRKGIVTMWDPIDNEVGLGDSPDWYVDYKANIRYNDNAMKNIFYNTQVYSMEDHVCMAKNIYFEARNESLQGQMAIALVTLQRVKDYRYPNTVCGVVYENKQFSWYSDGLSDRPRNSESYEDIALLASAMLDSETSVFDFTYGSTHYHANYVSPYWTDYMILKARIDTHIFYYEPVIHTTASL